jgi:hypothetical protein
VGPRAGLDPGVRRKIPRPYRDGLEKTTKNHIIWRFFPLGKGSLNVKLNINLHSQPTTF